MKALEPRSIFSLLLVFSMFGDVSLELTTVFQAACVNEFLELPCPVQDPSSDSVWKYKREKRDVNWQEIGSFSKNNTSLSQNIPAKFQDMTNVTSNGSLIISSFAKEMTGIYVCQLVNEGQVHHNMFKVVAVNCQKTVCEGDVAIVECDLLKYKNFLYLNQLKQLVWKQKSTTLVVIGHDMKVTYTKYPNVGAIQMNGALRIGSASKDIDGQRYTCVVHGEKGVTSRQYSVVVNVQKCQKKITKACEGESIDLKCPYYPPLTTKTKNIRLEWYKGSTKIATVLKDRTTHPDSSLVKINEANGMVTFVSIGDFDNGLYRCKVFRDTVLLAEHSVTLNVTQCRPSPTGHQKPTKEEARAKAEKIRDICLLTFFAVFVCFAITG